MLYHNFFILGNPRSGTSMFRMMIGSHSSAIVPPECGFIQWWYDKYKDWSINNSSSSSNIRSFIADLKTSKKIETWNLDFMALEFQILQILPKSYAELASTVILQYALEKNKHPKILGDKNNYYIDHLNLLNIIYPKAKYLIIIRDCRDVVCSYLNVNKLATGSKYKPNFPQTIEAITMEWVNNNNSILNFLETIENDKYVMVKYEDLLMQPKLELQKCLELFGLNFEDNMLSYYKNKMEPDELLDWKMKTNEKVDENNTNNFLEQLSRVETSKIESIAGDLMLKFGYL